MSDTIVSITHFLWKNIFAIYFCYIEGVFETSFLGNPFYIVISENMLLCASKLLKEAF